MFKLLLIIIYASIIIIVSPFIFLLMRIFLRNNQQKIDTFCQSFITKIFNGVLFICGTTTTVIGAENIPKDTAVLYVGNHRSNLDILIPYKYFNTPTGYVAKKEIDKIPVLRTWMRYIKCLFLDRSNIKEGLKTILTGIENVKNGYSMVIFPEGTRSKEDEILPFKEGSLKIAEKSGCPIIPVTQNNTSAILEDHAPFFKKAHTVLEFGKPIIISELAPEDKKFLGAYCQNIIKETYERNKALV